MLMSLHILLQRYLLFLRRYKKHHSVAVEDLQNNIFVMKFGMGTNTIGLEEKICVLLLIKKHDQYRNLLIHIATGVQVKYISINSKCIRK